MASTVIGVKSVKGVLCWVCVQKPKLKYEEVDKFEYTLNVIVDEETAEAFDEEVSAKSASKKIKTSLFEDKFLIEPPFPDEKYQYVLKISRSAQYPDGTPIQDKIKPRVYMKKKGREKLSDVTDELLVGNGSEGLVKYELVDNGKFGVSARLVKIRVDELVEYIAPDQSDDEVDEEFGEIEDPSEDDFEDESPRNSKGSKTSVKGKVEKSGKTSKVQKDEDPDEDEEKPKRTSKTQNKVANKPKRESVKSDEYSDPDDDDSSPF